ncbi:MAG: hypothetical protein ACKO41_05850 [Sphingomonadales bacterium]
MFLKQPLFFLGFLMSVGCIFSSCQDQPGHAGHGADHTGGATSTKPLTAEDSLYHQVMDVHDEVMPKMGKVRGAQQKAQQKLDSLSARATGTDKNYRKQLERLISDLNYADFAMDKWMVEFNMDSAKGNTTLRMQYLQDELEKVKKVKAAILGSLAGADSLIRR